MSPTVICAAFQALPTDSIYALHSLTTLASAVSVAFQIGIKELDLEFQRREGFSVAQS